MDTNQLLLEVSDKNLDIDHFVELAINDAWVREELVKQLVSNPFIMVYYHCYYILSRAAEVEPSHFYKHWNDFESLLYHKNSYHRDIALTLIANLTVVDGEDRFQKISEAYFSHVNDEKFMTAECCIRNIKKIIRNKPVLTNRILDILLYIDRCCTYSVKQKELLKYGILEILDDLYLTSGRQEEILEFILRQTDSVSPKTRKKTAELIRKYTIKHIP
ncbi:MAG: hypothetical protein N2484_12515 [Clostridia bacterium]|nr:hypothetical protein [Clostridia bacterium]